MPDSKVLWNPTCNQCKSLYISKITNDLVYAYCSMEIFSSTNIPVTLTKPEDTSQRKLPPSILFFGLSHDKF